MKKYLIILLLGIVSSCSIKHKVIKCPKIILSDEKQKYKYLE